MDEEKLLETISTSSKTSNISAPKDNPKSDVIPIQNTNAQKQRSAEMIVWQPMPDVPLLAGFSLLLL